MDLLGKFFACCGYTSTIITVSCFGLNFPTIIVSTLRIYYICVARFNASTLNIPTESLGPFSDSSDLIYVALIRNMSSDPCKYVTLV